MRLKQFVAATITPAVLILGLLAIALVHFRNDVSLALQHTQGYQSVVAYNSGQLTVDFTHDQGAERPLVAYNQITALRYSEWDSYLIVDGQIYPLWNQNHGYAFDDQHQRIASTMTGANWQLVQVTTLAADHVDVAYSFDMQTGPVDTAAIGPHHVTVVLSHWHNYWLAPIVHGTTFTAGITTLYQDQDVILDQTHTLPNGTTFQPPQTPVQPNWIMQLQAQPAPGVAAAVQLANAGGNTSVSSQGATPVWANQLTTTYTLTNPDLNVLLPVATETITLQPPSSQ